MQEVDASNLGESPATVKRILDNLRASEKRYRAIIDSIPMGMHLYQLQADDRLVFIGANPAADKLLGIDNNQFIGKTLEDAFPSLAQTEIPQRYRLAAKKGIAYSTEQITYEDRQITGAFEVYAFGTGPDQMAATFLEVTTRKQTDAALKESENRYRELVETSPVPIMVHSEDKIIFANKQAKVVLGVTGDLALEGRNIATIVHPDYLPLVRSRVKRMYENNQGVSFQEEKFVRLDGMVIDVEVNTCGITYEGNRAAQVAFTDITLRKKAEAERDRLFNLSIDLFCIAGFDGSFKRANPAWTHTLGWSNDELLSSRYIDYVHKDDYDETISAMEMLARGQMVIGFENRYRCKDGSYKWIAWNSFPLLDEELVFAVARDITGQREMTDRLQEAEQRWNFALEGAGQGAWDWNIAKGSVIVSSTFASLLGYTLTSLPEPAKMQLWWMEQIHPQEREEVLAKQRNAVAQKEAIFESEYRMLHADGDYRWIHHRGKTIESDSNGSALRIIGTIADISESRQIQERLRQSEKMEAIGQLAGGVAHDFNNQLAGIMGYADLLRESLATDPQLASYADMIIKAAQHSSRLTGQLLAFARKGKYQSVPVAVHSVIDEVVSILEHSIDRRITIDRNLQAFPDSINGDQSQIQNALLNIALNARDAMPAGGTILFATNHVTLSGNEPFSQPADITAGEYLRISVSDTGIGMDRATMRRIFEPFFTTKDPGKGTGMGLAAVYGIAKNHKGAVHLESTPGQGTTFNLYLPLGSQIPQNHSVNASDRAQKAPRSAHLLLVDDEPVVLSVAQAILQNLGHTVTTCRNGREAVEFFSKHHAKIDLVILDLIMPELSGQQTFGQLRKIDPKVRVVLSSGYSLDGEAQKVLDAGAKAFIQKPYSQVGLAEIVNSQLI